MMIQNISGLFLGYTTLTSPFGKRTSPTVGASSFHKGIDVGAPEGTKLYAVCDGKITFAAFLGGGGYTITLSHDNMKISYCHVSPNFIVSVGDTVKKGEWIANVGPKNVYGVVGNNYKDKNGNPTNGATTRMSFASWSTIGWKLYKSFRFV